MHTFEKDPDATLDYYWDWALWLGNDAIESHQFLIPAGMNLVSSSETDGVITAWLSGGTDKTSHIVTCRVATTAGRQEDRSAIFQMAER